MADFEENDLDTLRIEKDVVGASTFVGYARSQTAATSQPVWLIKRITISGNATEVIYAAGSTRFDQIWDDRVSLFATPPFSNDNSLKFSGTNDRLVFPNHISSGGTLDFDMLSAFSCTFWLRSSKTGEQTIIGKQGGATTVGWRVTTQSNQLRFKASSGSGTTDLELRSASLSLNDDNWHHIGFSMSSAAAPVSGNYAMVIDGVDVTAGVTEQSDQFTTSAANSVDALIGVRSTTALDLDGFLDELGVWDLELSVAELQTVYNSGIALDLVNSGPQAANLQLWCRCGDNDTFPNITNLGVAGSELDMVMTDMKASDIVGEVP